MKNWKMKLSTWSLMLLTVITFNACGSSSDDDSPVEPDTGKGVYRIDVTFDTPIAQGVQFGIVMHGFKTETIAAKLYENGKELTLNDVGNWGESVEEPRNYSIQTEEDCIALSATFLMEKPSDVASAGFTVTGYKDGKKVDEHHQSLTDNQENIRVQYQVNKNGGDIVGFVDY